MATVISENHNVREINIQADDWSVRNALKSAAGIPWDAYEYGITREEVDRRIDEADTPEARALVLEDLRDRAIRRANLSTNDDGRIMFAGVGDGDWHGLGTRVDSAMTADEAMKLGGLDEESFGKIETFGCKFEFSGEYYNVPGVCGVGRRHNGGEAFTPFPGVSVGSDYRPFQVRECFSFLDDVLGEIGGAHYDTVGAINDGRTVWINALMPEWAEPVLGDEVRSYVCLSNSFDASSALRVFSTNTRTVCANTHRVALQGGRQCIAVRHTKRMKDYVSAAKSALGLTRSAFRAYAEMASDMARTSVDPKLFVNGALDRALAHCGVTSEFVTDGVEKYLEKLPIVSDKEREVASKKYARMVNRRGRIFDNVMEIYESTTNTATGSVWAAYNAVTEHANHSLKYRGNSHKQSATRFDSILTGRADAINQAALVQASETLAIAS